MQSNPTVERMSAADLAACVERSEQTDVPVIPAALMRRLVSEVMELSRALAAARKPDSLWRVLTLAVGVDPRMLEYLPGLAHEKAMHIADAVKALVAAATYHRSHCEGCTVSPECEDCHYCRFANALTDYEELTSNAPSQQTEGGK